MDAAQNVEPVYASRRAQVGILSPMRERNSAPDTRMGVRSRTRRSRSANAKEILGEQLDLQFPPARLRVQLQSRAEPVASPRKKNSPSRLKSLSKSVTEKLRARSPVQGSDQYFHCKLFRQRPAHPNYVYVPKAAPFDVFPPLEPATRSKSHRVLVFFDEPQIDISAIEFLLPVEGAHVRKIDGLSLALTWVNGQGEKQETYVLTAEDRTGMEYWLSKLRRVCNSGFTFTVGGNSSQEQMALLRYKCNFSPRVRLQSISSTSQKQLFVGGLLEDVVEFILFHTAVSPGENQAAVLDILLSSYSSFTTVEDLFTALAEGITKHASTGKLKASWIERWKLLIRHLEQAHWLDAPQRIKLIVACYDALQTSPSLPDLAYSPSNPYEIDLGNLEGNIRMVPNSQWKDHERESADSSLNERILAERSKAIAEQLTVIEASYHLGLTPAQLLFGDEDPHVRRLTTWWNKVCGWVATVILQQPSPKQQARSIRKFVSVAMHLIDLRNYSTASQIASALQHTTIDRLRGYKEHLSLKALDGLTLLQSLFAPKGNYKAYRALNFESPSLRFVAVHQRDLRFILDGNSAFLDASKQLINFDRALMLGQCLWSVGCLRAPTAYYYPQLQKDEALYSLLAKISYLHDDQLFSLSFLTEACRSEEARPQEEQTVQNPLFGTDRLPLRRERSSHLPSRRKSDQILRHTTEIE